MTASSKKGSSKGSAATVAIVLVTSLFFVWGLTMNLVNALNSPMANYLELSGTEASLLQVAYYGAYFVMAIPASIVAKKFGYKGGVVMGLALFVLGSLITVPATNAASYGIFLLAMFVIAAGASTLETNCNPYITKLGDEKHESMRLNLAQSFNGVGNIVGPLILSQFLGSTVAAGDPGFVAAKLAFLSSMRGMYIVIAVVLAVVLAVFVFVKLPTPPGDEEEASGNAEKVSIGSDAQASLLCPGRLGRVHLHRPAGCWHVAVLWLCHAAVAGHDGWHRRSIPLDFVAALYRGTLRVHPDHGKGRARQASGYLHDRLRHPVLRGVFGTGPGVRCRDDRLVPLRLHWLPHGLLAHAHRLPGFCCQDRLFRARHVHCGRGPDSAAHERYR